MSESEEVANWLVDCLISLKEKNPNITIETDNVKLSKYEKFLSQVFLMSVLALFLLIVLSYIYDLLFVNLLLVVLYFLIFSQFILKGKFILYFLNKVSKFSVKITINNLTESERGQLEKEIIELVGALSLIQIRIEQTLLSLVIELIGEYYELIEIKSTLMDKFEMQELKVSYPVSYIESDDLILILSDEQTKIEFSPLTSFLIGILLLSLSVGFVIGWVYHTLTKPSIAQVILLGLLTAILTFLISYYDGKNEFYIRKVSHKWDRIIKIAGIGTNDEFNVVDHLKTRLSPLFSEENSGLKNHKGDFNSWFIWLGYSSLYYMSRKLERSTLYLIIFVPKKYYQVFYQKLREVLGIELTFVVQKKEE